MSTLREPGHHSAWAETNVCFRETTKETLMANMRRKAAAHSATIVLDELTAPLPLEGN
jgi:hypothetical protein